MNAVVQTQFIDPFWQAALDQALAATASADCVLVPDVFVALHPKFAPLEFSWGLKNFERLAWCCSKDDVDRLAPWLHEAAADADLCAWSNEVFVVGGAFKPTRAADAESRRHLGAWFERLARYRTGVPNRATHARPFGALKSSGAEVSSKKPRVLLVGASQMGNVGDDLLAASIGEMLSESGAEVFISGPDIDPLHVAAYDAVVIGGGGLIYASEDGAEAAQNLANYLKFGLIAQHFGVAAALIGVGDQDHDGSIESSPMNLAFARAALPTFKAVSVRDHDSAALLSRLGARDVRVGADAVLNWLPRARKAVTPSVKHSARIALVGEFYRYDAFARGFGEGGSLATEVRDGEFDLLIMSDDDVPHAQRMGAALKKAGAGVAILDLRQRDFESLVFLFASYRAVVTTRFHGLVLAAMSAAPVVAIDCARGKKARLMRELGAIDGLIVDDGSPGALQQLSRALAGACTRLSMEQIEKLAATTAVHRDAAGRITAIETLSPAPAASAKVKAAGGHKTRPIPDVLAPIGGADEGAVHLCWAASSEHTNGYGNLGDSLSAVMASALSGRAIKHTNFDEPRTKLVAVGSIGHAINNGTAVIWGSGVSIRGGVLAENVRKTNYDIRAIRGPISAQHFRDFGIGVPEVYGDPVWLLPSILNEPVEKRFELGVIPHIQDIDRCHPDGAPKADSLRYIVSPEESKSIAIINTWHEPTWEGLVEKIRLIRSCKRIVSQSFHGVVIAEAYGIPVLNFRHLPKARNGLTKIDLMQPCATDPRIWEFFKGGPRPWFLMYAQKRDERSNWGEIIRTLDAHWEPFEYDPSGMIDAFPLPLAYDPMKSVIPSLATLRTLRF